MPYAMGEKLTKAMPPAVMGKDISLSGIFDPKDKRYSEAAEFRQVHETDPEAQRVVELARGIEGLKRQWGVHAAGVIMSSDPLIDIIPIMKRPQDGAVITQFDYPTSEGLGLIKMDFLGLRNLTILDDALENIVMNGKDPVDIENVALDDKATYELLASGNTLGVFQLDGGAMRSLLRQMRPDNFEDVSAVIALYRPGPMGMNSHINYALRKNGQQKIEAIHPEVVEPFAEILDETHGLIVYQEQVQRAAQIMAGYTLGQADLLRRAMGKKKPEVLAKEYVNFEKGAKEKGYSAAAIKAVWDTLVPFAGYAFNKAHSAGYGLVAYWTAYLKANYPAEYMAGLLQSVGDNKDKMALYLNECRRMGITVLPPDVNDSAAKFTAVKGDIRFGLTGVRNVGRNVVDAIVEAREEKGGFTSFQDFLDKVPAPVCNKRTIESLIKAGAFDSLGHTRRSLLVVHEQAVDSVIGVKRKEAEGQFDLFADFGGSSDDEAGMGFSVEVPDLPDWEKKQKLQFEREMLGLYVSDHPLSGLEHVLQRAADTSIASLIADEGRPDNSQVTVAGLLTSVQRKMSKNGNPWAAVTVEDLEGAVEVMFFGETYLAYSTMLVEDQVVVLRGRVRRRDETLSLQAMELAMPDITVGSDSPLAVTVPHTRAIESTMVRLREVLATHPGSAEVHVVVAEPGKKTLVRASDSLRVEKSPALFGDLKALLGQGCLS
jgi:DNA polymerase-3 subunit alpha